MGLLQQSLRDVSRNRQVTLAFWLKLNLRSVHSVELTQIWQEDIGQKDEGQENARLHFLAKHFLTISNKLLKDFSSSSSERTSVSTRRTQRLCVHRIVDEAVDEIQVLKGHSQDDKADEDHDADPYGHARDGCDCVERASGASLILNG